MPEPDARTGGERAPPPAEGSGRWARGLGLAAGVLAFLLIAFTPSALSGLAGNDGRAARTLGVVALMALWWLTEAAPIALTACVPLVAFPLLGVFGGGPAVDLWRAAEPYGDGYILLFLGGMVIGAAIEAHGLHRRLALHVLLAVGGGPARILLGVLLATALVSLWISNTATAVMMLPIAVALIHQLELGAGRPLPALGNALLLGVAYAANVGGIGTKIGTGTNSIFSGYVEGRLGLPLGFFQFMLAATPFVLLFLPVVWLVLWRTARHESAAGSGELPVLRAELAALGPPSPAERRVAIAFMLAAALWMLGDLLRPPLAALVQAAAGWRLAGKHYEAAVAMSAALALLTLGLVRRRELLRLPYSTLVLLGGSFAMAAGIEGSGLSAWLAAQFRGLGGLPLGAQLGIAAGGSVLLSAIASNTATMNVMLTVLPQRTAVLFAACLGASCDFMLPAGTPPNAIVFGSGRVRLSSMMRTGFVLDVLAVGAIAAWVGLVARFVLPG